MMTMHRGEAARVGIGRWRGNCACGRTDVPMVEDTCVYCVFVEARRQTRLNGYRVILQRDWAERELLEVGADPHRERRDDRADDSHRHRHPDEHDRERLPRPEPPLRAGPHLGGDDDGGDDEVADGFEGGAGLVPGDHGARG